MNVRPEFDAGANETVPAAAAGVFSWTGIAFSDPGLFDLHTVTIDYDGDGIIDQTLNLPLGVRTFDLHHVYAAGGNYPVTVTVADDDGGGRTDTFVVVAAQSPGLLDGKKTAGSLGGVVDNTQDSDAIGGIAIGAGGFQGIGYNFARIAPSRLQGLVWVDADNDGDVDFGEAAIEGVIIRLTGTDDRGAAVDRVMETDSQGIFEFLDVRPSNAAGYTLTQEQPAGFQDGIESLGTVNGVLTGTAVDNVFSDIAMTLPGSHAINYNFGERVPSGTAVHAGQTATIGFWQNKNGQALIKSLNGGANATALGNWLAARGPSAALRNGCGRWPTTYSPRSTNWGACERLEN